MSSPTPPLSGKSVAAWRAISSSQLAGTGVVSSFTSPAVMDAMIVILK
jgi:hypothetical protein